MKSHATVRYAVYIRVNVASRVASVQAQRDATREFIKRRTPQGWTYGGTYEDLGDSGDTLDRPALQTTCRHTIRSRGLRRGAYDRSPDAMGS